MAYDRRILLLRLLGLPSRESRSGAKPGAIRAIVAGRRGVETAVRCAFQASEPVNRHALAMKASKHSQDIRELSTRLRSDVMMGRWDESSIGLVALNEQMQLLAGCVSHLLQVSKREVRQ